MATLSLNPSYLEFQDGRDRELSDCFRRLATHQSLGVCDLENAPLASVAEVLKDCNQYFQRNPYEWFNDLELILNACGSSYCDGSACHLDLIQWATKPTWTKLPSRAQSCLLDSDLPFLKEQLRNENIKLLLVNGRRVIKEFESAFCTKLRELRPVEAYGKTICLYDGFILDRVRVIAWSAFVQRGVTTEMMRLLAERVEKIARGE